MREFYFMAVASFTIAKNALCGDVVFDSSAADIPGNGIHVYRKPVNSVIGIDCIVRRSDGVHGV
jgi:hypothetical protein